MMMRFVVVNGREQRRPIFCALCCNEIKGSYVREIQTRVFYCSPEHYFGACKVSVALLEHHARRIAQ